jgi:NADH:ubiquinone oxidoreductase subunit 3 (subunit A)
MLSYILVITTIILLLISLSLFIAKTKPDSDAKLSPYECGMNPLGDARHKFRIDYILIGILFIIFDLEIVFLFPYLILFPLENSILAY